MNDPAVFYRDQSNRNVPLTGAWSIREAVARAGMAARRALRRQTIPTPAAKTSALTPISSGPEVVEPGTSQRQEGPDGFGRSATANEVSAEHARNTIAAIVLFCITMSPRMKTYPTSWETIIVP